MAKGGRSQGPEKELERFSRALSTATHAISEFSRATENMRRGSIAGMGRSRGTAGGAGSGRRQSAGRRGTAAQRSRGAPKKGGGGKAGGLMALLDSLGDMTGLPTGLSQGITSAANTGSGLGNSIGRATLRSVGAALPVLGGIARELSAPIEGAAKQTSQLVETIARAGGEVDDNFVNDVNQRFLKREIRARNARRQVEANVNDNFSQQVQQSFEGSRAEEIKDALVNLATELANFSPFGGNS